MELLKDYLNSISSRAFKQLADEFGTSLPEEFNSRVDYPPANLSGQYAIPNCLELAKTFRESPREIASKFCKLLTEIDLENKHLIDKLNIEGPGFVNIEITDNVYKAWLGAKLNLSTLIATNEQKRVRRSILEFVSANPTGPLNIVSARAAALGDTMVRILRVAGEQISSEYYVNNFGNQVRMLGISLGIRLFNEIKQSNHPIPEEGYQGEYLIDLAKSIVTNLADFSITLPDGNVPNEEVMAWAEENHEFFSEHAVTNLLASQKKDLEEFNVSFDKFYLESELHSKGKVDEALQRLQQEDVTYEKEGATFFQSSKFGDDKDRVIKRADGRPTYLLADIAYHKSKYDRGFTNVMDIWGPDHHGYISRLSSAIDVLNKNYQEKTFKVLICQQVNLLEDGKSIVMSKRLGKFHTMRDLLEKIPVDVLRYFFVQRSISTHLDFDINLALNQSSQNPVYYIQYAHARICSILAEFDSESGNLENGTHQLSNSAKSLFFHALRYPEEVREISQNLEVQRLPQYLYDLASVFTSFYHDDQNKIKELVESNGDLALAYLRLCKLTKLIFAHGLNLLGISAPESM